MEAFNNKYEDTNDSIDGSIGDASINLSDVEIILPQSKIKYKKVDFDEVEQIGIALKLGFIAKGMDLERVESHLFVGANNSAYTSIMEI